MKKILIVDDNELNRDVLYDALEGEDYELHEAEDGEDALKKTAEIQPDLILLDVEMPVMDGVTALKKLKEQTETQHIPVIMVTALNTETQIAICLDNGAIDHIVKPFSNMVIRSRVRVALRSQATAFSENDLPQSPGKIITIVGSKGGVGATTVALNLGACLVESENSVTVCELRHNFGTMAAQMNASPALNMRVLLDENSGSLSKQKIKDCLVFHPSGLKLLLGPQDFHSVDITAEQVELIGHEISQQADYTLFDVSDICSKAVDAVLKRSDMVLLVVEFETASLAAAKIWKEKIVSLGIISSKLEVVGVSRSNVGLRLSPDDLRCGLGTKIVGVIPADPDSAAMAVQAGLPTVLHQPESNMANSLFSLAHRMTAEQLTEIAF